ncbi:MAG: radical SAM family heme chaperone HemW, partial [Bacteroidales bacterium]|nr:radical SAM family heme chaperone HemW [Bacteroidales bacterium]
MPGIYIHIPFCSRFCNYCDFYSRIYRENLADQYTEALIREAELRSSFFEGAEIDTIYIGGGTPSLLSAGQLEKIVNGLKKNFFSGGNLRVKEFTIEVNPDDTDPDYYKELLSLGINRLSIGIQSFCDDELRWMNRRHTAAQALKSYYDARAAGFTNISTDLIFGSGLDNGGNWRRNLKKITELAPEHISAYQLGIESGTKLDRMVKEGRYSPADQEFCSEQYSLLQSTLMEAGYNQYEVSNFAREGYCSLHNSSYWNHTPYLGLGPSAHSYSGMTRSRNPKSLRAYTDAQINGKTFVKIEKLSKKDIFNEKIMLSLRRIEGVDKEELKSFASRQYYQTLMKNVSKALEKGDLEEEDNRLKIPAGKLFVSDSIIRE